MLRRNLLAGLFAVLTAAGCIRLGIWQLDRLAQRRAHNATLVARLHAAPVPLAALPTDSTVHYRRVHVSGTYDFDHEIVLSGRTRNGSPGVNLITPLRTDDGARVVMVNRGWVYSPDASTVDRSRYLQREHASLAGYVDVFPPSAPGDPRSSADPRTWRRLDAARLSATLPYPIEPYYVVALPDSASAPSANLQTGTPGDTVVRLALPSLDEGPHKSYAIQWFSFAAIAIVGVTALVVKDVQMRR